MTPRAQALAAMVAAMPPGVPGAELLARYAWHHYRRGVAFGLAGKGDTAAARAYDREATEIRQAAEAIRQAFARMTPGARTRMAHALSPYGVDAERLRDDLTALVEATGPADVGAEADTDPETPGLLAAGRYLTTHGLKRAQAAKVCAALLGTVPDAKAKSWRTIEQTLRNAGIGNSRRPIEKLKPKGRKGFVFLTR